jgi:hypothetical protein
MPSFVEALKWSAADLAQYVGPLSGDLSSCLEKGPQAPSKPKTIERKKNSKTTDKNSVSVPMLHPAWRECFPEAMWEKATPVATVRQQSLVRQKISYWYKTSKINQLSEALWRAEREQNICDEKVNAETYALALVLEDSFPQPEAMEGASRLLERVTACSGISYRDDAWIRAGLFRWLMGQKDLALSHFKKVDLNNLNSRDRSLYLRKLLGDSSVTQEYLLSLRPIPWGMYGHLLLGSDVKSLQLKPEFWRLQMRSEQPHFHQLISLLAQLTAFDQKSALEVLARHLNYESLKAESPQFQATVALFFHKAQMDLPTFRLVHQILAHHPSTVSRDLLPFLFPIRYWNEITHAAGNDLSPILVKSLIRQESAFATRAISSAKAMGLMQLIPSTAKKLGVHQVQALYDPKINIQLGTRYLRSLIQQFGSVELALASYNAGPKKVETWLKRYPTKDMELFVELIPYRETREYVRLIKRNQAIYQEIFQGGDLIYSETSSTTGAPKTSEASP